jgi:hypothetical protein
VTERKRDQRRDHRLGAADAVLHVAHDHDFVERQDQESAGSAHCRGRQGVPGHRPHLGEHVGEADALERSVQYPQGQAADQDADCNAEGGLELVAARIRHLVIL